MAHARAFTTPALYELAFFYRDYERECAFIRALAEKVTGRPLSRFVDVAAGPCCHGRTLAQQGVDVFAFDLSRDMVSYGRQRCAQDDVTLRYEVGDMRTFTPPGTFDAAANMLNGARYLLTDDDMLAHLRALAPCIREGGMYLIELPRSRDFDAAPVARWTVPYRGGEVSACWEELPGSYCGDTGRCEVKIELAYTKDGEVKRACKDVAALRSFHRDRMTALVERSGCFELVGFYGDLDLDAPLEPKAVAPKMITVLRRRSH